MAKNKNKKVVKEVISTEEVKGGYTVNNSENIDKAVEQIDSLITAMEEVKQEEDKKDIKDFINSMRGKSRANPLEIDIMYALYQKYTGRREANKTCSTCIMRVYQTLNKLIN